MVRVQQGTRPETLPFSVSRGASVHALSACAPTIVAVHEAPHSLMYPVTPKAALCDGKSNAKMVNRVFNVSLWLGNRTKPPFNNT